MGMIDLDTIKGLQSGKSLKDIMEAKEAAQEDSTCAVGKSCLETEALAELLKGEGIQMPVTTKALLDGIKSKIQVAQEMVGAAMNTAATATENGVFGMSSIFVEEIGNLGSIAGNTPRALQSVWGDGAFIDAIEKHIKTIMPDDLSKFAENFGQIEQAVEQSKKAMFNAVQGATESLSNPLSKVAGQFANMATGGLTGATFGAAASQLKGLGNLPLESGATALLETVQNFPSVQSSALDLFGTLDVADMTDADASKILGNITAPADLNLLKRGLGVAGSGGSALDFLDKGISSAGAITDGTFNNYVKDFAGDFGALANEGISVLGDTVEKLSISNWIPGQGSPPSGSSKISGDAASSITEQFGGGSGEYGEMTFRDLMGTAMGPVVSYDEFGNRTEKPSEFETLLTEYQNILSGNSEKFAMIRDACYGDWTGVISSSDGGTLEGVGANPSPIPNTAAAQLSKNAVLARLLPDAPTSNAADAVCGKIAAIMQKERDAWTKMSLPLSDAPKLISNVSALTGFADSLSSKMQNPGIKDALGNMLSGSTKALGDSAVFENALQNDVGVQSTNKVSPPPASDPDFIVEKGVDEDGFEYTITRRVTPLSPP